MAREREGLRWAAKYPGDPFLSLIETEARALLLKRRQALGRQAVPAAVAATAEDDFPSDSVRHELEEIDEALVRIDRGNYGSCVSCGGPLGLQRLRAIPEARYCLGCSGHRPADD